jgi:hypothetical protein
VLGRKEEEEDVVFSFSFEEGEGRVDGREVLLSLFYKMEVDSTPFELCFLLLFFLLSSPRSSFGDVVKVFGLAEKTSFINHIIPNFFNTHVYAVTKKGDVSIPILFQPIYFYFFPFFLCLLLYHFSAISYPYVTRSKGVIKQRKSEEK